MLRRFPLTLERVGVAWCVLGLTLLGASRGSAQEPIPTKKSQAPLEPKVFQPPHGAALLAPSAPNWPSIRRRLQDLHEERHHLTIPRRKPRARPAAIAEAPAAAPIPIMGPTLPPPAALGVMSPQDLEVLSRRTFSDAPFLPATLTTEAEPSVAARKDGNDIVVTANSFAALSGDQGLHWTFVDPLQKFQPQPEGREFFCDQVVLYDKSRDLMVWYMQHRFQSGEGNLYRLAVATGDKIHLQQYSHYDITPTSISSDWANTMLDYPDIVMSKNFLYVSTNVFKDEQQGKGSVTLRISLDDLRDLKPLEFDIFSTAPLTNDAGFGDPNTFGDGSLRGTRSASGGDQTTMYFGTHPDQGNNSLKIYKWDENQTKVTSSTVGIATWAGGQRDQVHAFGPDGRDYLARIDSRITAAWNAGNAIGFAWSAASGPDTKFKNPHVRAALISKADMTLLSEPHLYSDAVAYAYPAAAPTASGELGIAVAFGGSAVPENQSASAPPSFALGVLRTADNPGNSQWQLTLGARGQVGPVSPEWGDYFWICEDPSSPATWFGAGFTAIDPMGQGVSSANVIQVARFRRPPSSRPALLPGVHMAAAAALATPQEVTRSEFEAVRREIDFLRRQNHLLSEEIQSLRLRVPNANGATPGIP